MPADVTLTEEEIEVRAPIDADFCECNCDACDPPAMVCTDIPDIGYHHCT